MWSVCIRRRDASHSRRIASADSLDWFGQSPIEPHTFVASTTLSRRPPPWASHRPTMRSVTPSPLRQPYTFAVSKKVMPCSSARSMIVKESSSEVSGPKFIVPRHSRETSRPARPRWVYLMRRSLRRRDGDDRSMHPIRPRHRSSVPVGLVAVVAVLVTVVGGWLVRLLAHRPPSPADHGPPPAGSRTVLTEDGVPLHVELDGDPRAAFTVVLVHGFTARLGEFDRQRAALRDRARLVLYDHRGHGRSGWGDVRHATIDQLGRDLSRVLDAVVPDGPVVLIGHSLGGMTVMALAEQRPELFGPRVVGVALLATSAGRLTEVGPGARFVSLLVRLHLLRLYLRLLRWI